MKLILLIIWLSGIIPSLLWIKKHTDISWLGCAIMSVGSWGIVLLAAIDKLRTWILTNLQDKQ